MLSWQRDRNLVGCSYVYVVASVSIAVTKRELLSSVRVSFAAENVNK